MNGGIWEHMGELSVYITTAIAVAGFGVAAASLWFGRAQAKAATKQNAIAIEKNQQEIMDAMRKQITQDVASRYEAQQLNEEALDTIRGEFKTCQAERRLDTQTKFTQVEHKMEMLQEQSKTDKRELQTAISTLQQTIDLKFEQMSTNIEEIKSLLLTHLQDRHG